MCHPGQAGVPTLVKHHLEVSVKMSYKGEEHFSQPPLDKADR